MTESPNHRTKEARRSELRMTMPRRHLFLWEETSHKKLFDLIAKHMADSFEGEMSRRTDFYDRFKQHKAEVDAKFENAATDGPSLPRPVAKKEVRSLFDNAFDLLALLDE